jgi:D-xylose transport system permease protein
VSSTASAEVSAEQPRRRLPQINLGRAGELLPLAVALIATVIVFRVGSEFFLTARNLTNLLVQVAPLALVAIASTLVIVMGEIDLSLGSVAGLAGAFVAIELGHPGMPWWGALGLTLLLGLCIALMQGIFVLFGKIQSFAVTLAGYFIWYGVQIGILGSKAQESVRRAPIAELASSRLSTSLAVGLVIIIGGGLLAIRYFVNARDSHEAKMSHTRLLITTGIWAVAIALVVWFVSYLKGGGGVPLIFAIVMAIAAIVWLVLTRVPFGRHLYAVGGSEPAARAMGIPIAKIKLVTFAAAGALAAFAGVVSVSYTGGATTSTGGGVLLLEGIGATVVGGVSLLGGRGSVWGAFCGAVLLAAVQNGLALLQLQFYVVYIAQGGVVLFALLADSAIRSRLVRS